MYLKCSVCHESNVLLVYSRSIGYTRTGHGVLLQARNPNRFQLISNGYNTLAFARCRNQAVCQTNYCQVISRSAKGGPCRDDQWGPSTPIGVMIIVATGSHLSQSIKLHNVTVCVARSPHVGLFGYLVNMCMRSSCAGLTSGGSLSFMLIGCVIRSAV
jgi:hypothetical protein